MTRAICFGFGLALALAVAPLAARADDACTDCRYSGALEAIFVAPQALGADWDIVQEAPENALEDPELRRAGVRTIRALHYTQPVTGGSRACSVEIWRFSGAETARRAAAGYAREGWRIRVLGNLWLMAHGVELRRGGQPRPGLLPDCQRLAQLTETRAVALMQRAPAR